MKDFACSLIIFGMLAAGIIGYHAILAQQAKYFASPSEPISDAPSPASIEFPSNL
jgi:hypothetical protein